MSNPPVQPIWHVTYSGHATQPDKQNMMCFTIEDDAARRARELMEKHSYVRAKLTRIVLVPLHRDYDSLSVGFG